MISKIHSLLVEQPMTIESIMSATGVSENVAIIMVVEMLERGLVEHKGEGRYGVVTNSERDLKSLLDFVKDDSLAATYQSLGYFCVRIIYAANTIRFAY